MKKVLIGLMICGMFTIGATFAAAQAQQNTGCGLGAQALKSSPWANDTLLGNLVVTFLNGISGNQTFGITSGTSECKAPAKIANNERLKDFVASNLDSLTKDIAAGQGESLDTLAELMQISAGQRNEAYAKLQANFSNIFTSEKIEAGEVIDNILTIIG